MTRRFFKKNPKTIRLNLSLRLILAMASMVLLTALASVIIFNVIITNQTRDVEAKVQKAYSEFQDYRRLNPPSPQPALDKIKQIINNPSLSPEAQFTQINDAIRRNSNQFSPQVVYSILRDSGLPVSVPYQRNPFEHNDAPASGPPSINSSPEKILKISGTTLNQNREDFLLSPVVQASLLGSGLAALCAVVLGFFLSRTVIKPLRGLEKASERIADGNYNLEVGPEGKDDVGRLARSFNKMARALRLTEQKRKDLVADVAHELRTPLSSIQGYTEVLRDGLVASRERQEEIYDHILKEVSQLTKMVESMRVWMSNEQALEHLNVEEVPASLSARLVLERFQPTANQKGVTLDLEIDDSASNAEVKADSDALNHILSNLVDNALRYTRAGGNVKLKIGPAAHLKDQSRQAVVWFAVNDNGQGIAAEHLPFVFERFYRVDKSRDRTTGGTGLGLAIVKDTIQALGGEVRIESQPGQGTTVSFWLPAVSQQKPVNRKTLPQLAGSKAS